MIQILSHRGIDLSNDFFFESSLEAFAHQLENGYGLEFDPQFTKDNEIIIFHDSDLKRISKEKDKRKIKEIDSSEFLKKDFGGYRVATLRDLLNLIEKNQAKGLLSAIHLKRGLQSPEYLDLLIKSFKNVDTDKFIFFDINIEAAKYLKEKNSNLKLAPSVAHLYDIARYNSAVGGTLLSIEEVLISRGLFDWVWLDEWDRSNKDGSGKTFYNADIFSIFRGVGLKIALVTPELHAISPGFLSAEVHPDSKDLKILKNRIKEIIDLSPDMICTNYPTMTKELIAI